MGSTMSKVAALVPLKVTSRRLPGKNLLSLADKPLFQHILDTIRLSKRIEKTYVYCSRSFPTHLLPDDVYILGRPLILDSDNVEANELFRYAVERIDSQYILLAHATSPFTTIQSIDRVLDAVLNDGYTTSFTATSHKAYAWYKGEPLNYSMGAVVQTQDIEPVTIENSGLYLFPKSMYLARNARIAQEDTKIVAVSSYEAIDIDEPEDYALASLIARNREQLHKRLDQRHVQQTTNHTKTKALIFDFDGVILDSVHVMERCWIAALQSNNIALSDYTFEAYKQHIGFSFMDILSRLGIVDPGLMEALYESYFEKASELVDQSDFFPDVLDAVRFASEKFPCALFTSKKRSVVQLLLDRHRIKDIFSEIVCQDDLPINCTKPSPYGLIKIALSLGISPLECLYLGDTPVDQKCARAAGAEYVHCAWGLGGLLMGGQYQLLRTTDMPALINEL